MTSEAASAPARRRWIWVCQILGLILAFYILEQDVEYQLMEMGYIPQAGTLGVKMDVAPASGPRTVVVTKFAPGSPMPAAGVAVGDLIHFDHAADWDRIPRLGESIGFTLTHQRQVSHRTVIAAPRPPVDPVSLMYETSFNIADVISLLIGVFILLRSGGKLATIALGGALISFGITLLSPQFLECDPRVMGGFAALNYGSSIVEVVMFVAFAILFYRDNGGRVPAAVWWGLALYTLAEFACLELSAWCEMTTVRLPLFGAGKELQGVLDATGFAASLGYLIAGWRRSSRDARRRYTLLLIAISAVIAAQFVQIALSILIDGYRHTPWVLAYSILSGVIAPVLFAYAILRHKVFDLGFAINRTLVYGVVSVVLLVGFGLVEWASEKFIPIESREKNLFIDAAIALGIFLVFHRVRDFAERIIEDVFFRSWRDNEKELRKFVDEGRFVLQRAALIKGLVKALKRFSGGSEVALYLPEDGTSDYVLVEGGFGAIGPRLDGDDDTLVSLRANRQPLETWEGTLALPMIHRNDVSGLVVIGHKRSGDAWRPDEREILAWAVLQVGHDLHALKVENLEADAAMLRQKVDILSAQVVAMAKVR